MREKILKDIIEAMKSKDKEKLSTLRMLKGAMQLEEINKKGELDDTEIINLISKQIKTRKESIEEFKKAYEVVIKVADEAYNDLDIVDFINEAACFHQLHNSVMIGEYYVYKKIYFN